MKALAKGILWIVFIIAFFGVSVKAGTEAELAKLINRHVNMVVHQGTCKLDAQGKLTGDIKQTKSVVRCEAGIEDDPNVHFILLYDDKGPSKFVRFVVDKKTQTTLWRAGVEV